MVWLMVAVGGAAGSVARYGVQRLAISYIGPGTVLGTLAVNLTGSFLLGFLATLILARFSMPTDQRLFITVGLLGGYTTFSTLSFETITLLEDGEAWRAIWTLAGNVFIGLAVAYLGILAARAL